MEDTRTATALLDWLEQVARDSDRLVHVHTLPARPARFGTWPTWAHPQVVLAYEKLGIARPWEHQAEAAQSLAAGQHTILASGTGSGKSLAGWLPILSQQTANKVSPTPGRISQLPARQTALYLAPTKALAADQVVSLERIIAAGQLPIAVGTADGDSSREMKTWARQHADIVATNPDFLHFSLLPNQQRWARFLRQLSVVIVDEIHSYRGVTGAHVALVLRRLLRLAHQLGAQPAVLLLSATIANPTETAARILGCPTTEIHAVTTDGSPAGRRHLVLWQPGEIVDLESLDPLIDTSQIDELPMVRRAATSEAAELTAGMIGLGSRVLTFVRSRNNAESVAGMTKERLSRTHPELTKAMAAYRGGYLPEERRELEKDLRSGVLRGLATTSALELGVDVAGLDATITAGWPGTRASLWQQAGRAGRAGSSGVSVFIAADNPLDSYFIHHPEDLLGEVEATAFDPTNPQVLAPHLCAAAAEAPLTEADFALFGLPDATLLTALVQRNLLRKRPGGWYWNATLTQSPHALTDLRGSATQIQVVTQREGALIGSVDAASADFLIHLGAIYVHQGRTFRVEATEPDLVLVAPCRPNLRTRASADNSASVVTPLESIGSAVAGVEWGFGEVEVATRVISYDLLRLPGMQYVRTTPLQLPARKLATRAVWWTFSAAALAAAGVSVDELPGALHAAEHAAIGMLPLLAQCDRWDIGGLSIAHHPELEQAAIFIHDAFPGGAGFTHTGFQRRQKWLSATRDLVRQCPCEKGCPRCIQSPKCGTNNDPLHKAGAEKILDLLVHSLG